MAERSAATPQPVQLVTDGAALRGPASQPMKRAFCPQPARAASGSDVNREPARARAERPAIRERERHGRRLRNWFTPDKDDRETRGVWFKFREVSSTCVSVGADGVITVMVVIKRIHRLAFATTMDQQWTVAVDLTVSHVHRPISFQGKLYMLDYHSDTTRIIEIEPPRSGSASSSPAPLPPPKLIATLPPTEPRGRMFYLAERDLEILLIGLGDPLYSRITVYRVADLVTLGKLVPSTSIGDNVIFVSERILSVSSRVVPNVEGDSVVMVHGLCKYPFFGQYQLGSNTWSPAADESGMYGVQSPCSLIYHIFTCCRPGLWNKGEICFQGKRSKHWWKVKRKWRHGA